ncbi:unnamed protein product [Rodentolepis nana]|uniref:SH2 domain-containing protein n=2 Tax=Rodentolepis nana TaxID=102285 RepID=A0A0R3TIG0_RODNA|nr:unnamed protein product [Rodentolepis nana]
MTTNLTPSSDLKLVVKLNKRLAIKPREDLLTRNLVDIYNEYDDNRNHHEKRFSSKLVATRNELIITKGSWWPSGPVVPALAFRNILQFSSIPGRPAKLLLLVKNDEGTKTELIVLKTKGQIYTNQLLNCLHKYVNAAQLGLVQNSPKISTRDSRPMSYQMEVTSSVIPSPRITTNSPMQKRRPPPSKPVEIVAREPRKETEAEKIITPQRIRNPPRPERVRRSIQQESLSTTNGNLNETYSRTTYDPETKIETLDSVVVYGQHPEKVSELAKKKLKSKKSKSRPPRELSSLSGGRKVSRELDENNTPWEVNICYIKHDPLVGCVEDESGPIYMYTAHQLVSRDDYDNYDSDESDGDGYSEESNSEDASSSDSQNSMDENKELERFMMLGGSQNVTAINETNGKNGKLNEIYEY